MPDATLSSMSDARDAEDTRLLEEGSYGRLVESYYGVIVQRCQARVRAQDALDVAAEVAVRLLAELKRGRRYSVPFRVVVHGVIGWKIKEHFEPARYTSVELDERLSVADPFAGFEDDLDFALDIERLLDGLPARAGEVARLRIVEELAPEEIAERLALDRNAVDQAWHRAKRVLVERVAVT
jgi:RNA polymerase sigma factor (sigma-70 family)